MRPSGKPRRRGAVAFEQVMLLGAVLPLAAGLIALALKALSVVERFIIEATTSPLL